MLNMTKNYVTKTCFMAAFVGGAFFAVNPAFATEIKEAETCGPVQSCEKTCEIGEDRPDGSQTYYSVVSPAVAVPYRVCDPVIGVDNPTSFHCCIKPMICGKKHIFVYPLGTDPGEALLDECNREVDELVDNEVGSCFTGTTNVIRQPPNQNIQCNGVEIPDED